MAELPPPTDVSSASPLMATLFARRRRLGEVEMDITPMIDMTFLLLIFFLVASRISAETPVKLPVAKHGVPVVSSDAVIVLLREHEGGRASVHKADGEAFPDGDLVEQEEQIGQYVKQRLEGPPTRHQFIVKAEGKVASSDVFRVMNAAAAAVDLETLHVAVLKEK